MFFNSFIVKVKGKIEGKYMFSCKCFGGVSKCGMSTVHRENRSVERFCSVTLTQAPFSPFYALAEYQPCKTHHTFKYKRFLMN